MYATTLYRPIAASSSDSPPKMPNIVAPNVHERVWLPRRSDNGITFAYGMFGPSRLDQSPQRFGDRSPASVSCAR